MKDPLGQAVIDYLETKTETDVIVQSDSFDDDVIPTKYFFRKLEEMPLTEQKAMEMANGKILDVGAGAGCHSIYLQNRGEDVTAVDISPLACECLKKRGIKNVILNSFANLEGEKYDTILFLMNGIGVEGGMESIPDLLNQLRKLLNEGGQVIFDSSDLRFLYENEDGSFDINLNDKYYGEFQFKMSYKDIEGDFFDWIYIDADTMRGIAEANGFNFEKVYEDEHYAYLAKMSLKE
jgi:SAM-dependent methyltransferase